ncbi:MULTISPECIES: helix-turn-helix domain-containing protein [unclassified Streptomyces]|uniref:helix-turn-helix domain-containing protein n=1 Tax=unclassified Streptomyces TaxID=2593676 RepID=UPI00382B9460
MSAAGPGGESVARSWTDTPQGGPTVLRIVLGTQLRRLREDRGISREAAGDAIRASHAKISRLELGRVGFKERDVADLLTLYGVADERERGELLGLARRANTPGWWHQYADVLPGWFETHIGLEEAAHTIRTYEVQFVPGLLQTGAYARAVMRLGHPRATESEVGRRVAMRMTRQKLLTRPGAPRLWVVLDEACLRRPLGGVEVMRGQLEYLMEAATLPHVTLQIAPFDVGGLAAAGGPVTILRFSEPALPDIVYLEQLTSALYLDKQEDVEHYLTVMDRLAAEAEPPRNSARLLASLIDRLG